MDENQNQLNSDLDRIMGSEINVSEIEREVATSGININSAIAESRAISNLNLDANNQDHQRDQKWKNDFHTIFLFLFKILAFLFLIMVFSLVAHWILPASWHWLNTTQLDQIKTLIAAALASKVISDQQSKIK